jgi:hypothetical protein
MHRNMSLPHPVHHVLAAALMLFANGAWAAQPCLSPDEVSAFDVAALKSQMMIVAITCGNQDGYNGVIEGMRPEFGLQERALAGWFSKAYGAAAQRRQDDYITQLANSRSSSALSDGQEMCARQGSFFQDITAGGGLAPYAHTRHYAQPIRLSACGEAGRASAPIAYDPVSRPVARSRSAHVATPRSRHHG